MNVEELGVDVVRVQILKFGATPLMEFLIYGITCEEGVLTFTYNTTNNNII